MENRQTAEVENYWVQGSPLTLRQAMQAFRSESDVAFVPDELRGFEQSEELQAHDASHVIFGCPSTLEGEIVLLRWNLLGATDFGQIYGRGLLQPEGRAFVRNAFRKRRTRDTGRAIRRGFVAMYRALRMTRRWPTFEYQQYLDRRLADIRHEFGIRLV